jgi:predicted nuclease of restriction endonuclease-like (RecB) superfamily
MLPEKNIEQLHDQIVSVIESSRQSAYKAVNTSMVLSYWDIGRLILEEEQYGKERANYGTFLISEMAKRLQKKYGTGYAQQSLRNYRQFYKKFPIRSAVRSELTWTHYKLIMRIENPNARAFYEQETIKANWDTRALERQIHTFYYERLLASSDRAGIEKEAEEKTAPLSISPRDFVKNPFVLEFLGIQPDHSLYESDLEQYIMNNLQQFILELGRGFAFVARQQYIRADTDEFYIDLVFYNYILKCFVLIDLKMGKLTHQDVGQMDMYVRMYEDRFKIEGDNPTIGIILCSERNETVVKYSVLNDSQQLFASKYMLYLPSEAELKAELERERMLAELRMKEEK